MGSLENHEVKKNNTKVKVLLFLLIILIFGLVGLSYLKFFSSKNAFVVLIENSFDYLESSVVLNTEGSVTGTFSLGMNLQTEDSSSMAILDIVNKIGMSGSYGIDYDNKLFYLNVDSSYDNKELLDANVYMQDGSGYFYLENLYDKYIQAPIEDYDSLFEGLTGSEDYQVILNSIKKAVLDSLKEEYFVQEKVTLRSQKVDKTTLKLTNDNYQEIMKSVTQTLLEDDEYLNSFAKVSDSDITQVKEDLSENLNNLEKIEDFDVSLYMKGSQFIQFEVIDVDEEMIVYCDGDKYIYEYSQGEEVLTNGNISIQKNDNSTTLKILVTVPTSKTSLEVVVNYSTQKNGKVNKADIHNQVLYDNLTEEDINGIVSKILENEGIVMIIQEIYTLMGSTDGEIFSSGGVITG